MLSKKKFYLIKELIFLRRIKELIKVDLFLNQPNFILNKVNEHTRQYFIFKNYIVQKKIEEIQI